MSGLNDDNEKEYSSAKISKEKFSLLNLVKPTRYPRLLKAGLVIGAIFIGGFLEILIFYFFR